MWYFGVFELFHLIVATGNFKSVKVHPVVDCIIVPSVESNVIKYVPVAGGVPGSVTVLLPLIVYFNPPL
jgi:hypothetical protein